MGNLTDAERARGLATLEQNYPCWYTWVGVGGLLYASRQRTSPPCVVRATDMDELRAKVETHESQHHKRA